MEWLLFGVVWSFVVFTAGHAVGYLQATRRATRQLNAMLREFK